MFDFTGRAKWYVSLCTQRTNLIAAWNRDAWKSVENTSTEDAYKKYVEAFITVRIVHQPKAWNRDIDDFPYRLLGI
jgi:hypothetical protein